MQPKFIGRTRAAFSFNVAETSITRMGIAAPEHSFSGRSSAASTREPTPEPVDEAKIPSSVNEVDPLRSISDGEAIRLVGIYEDEIACVHPIIETKDLVAIVPRILDATINDGRQYSRSSSNYDDAKDAHVLRIVIATALICETYGKNELSDRFVEFVKQDVGKISNDNDLDLKDIQIMAMLVRYLIYDIAIRLTTV